MLISHVHVKVKSNYVEAFKQATLENARNSVQEPGIARFDVIQSTEDQTSFVLVEAYRTTEAQIKHKETFHFKEWVQSVVEMMDAPRHALKYSNVFPDAQDWS